MNLIMTSRENAMKEINNYYNKTKGFSNAAVKFAKENNTGAAFRMMDIAMASTECAIESHEELWQLCGGEPTDDEFDALEKAEQTKLIVNNAMNELTKELETGNKK